LSHTSLPYGTSANLIRDPWIPVRHRGGASGRIAPWQITEELGSDPRTAFASAREQRPWQEVERLVFLTGTGMNRRRVTLFRTFFGVGLAGHEEQLSKLYAARRSYLRGKVGKV